VEKCLSGAGGTENVLNLGHPHTLNNINVGHPHTLNNINLGHPHTLNNINSRQRVKKTIKMA
jgi:hypothetical protein